MKKYTLLVILFILIIISFIFYKTSNNTENAYVIDPGDMYVVENGTSTDSNLGLTTDERKWLIFMREEEKLARDVYTTLGSKWKLNIFSNIASSEQTHTDAVKALLIRYEIEDPSANETIGVFTSPVIQKLYNDLIAQGEKSSLDALIVGATIEDLDINDLDDAISNTRKSDILQVYRNLQKGSRNHLRAFSRNIESSGGVYVPKYISQELFNSIISSPQEKGRI